MSAKPVVPRAGADRDITEAVDYYSSTAGAAVAHAFIDALERAFRHIASHPAAGSSRYAHELDLPGLRAWPVRRYPHIIFYGEQESHIDVWRVLHAQRDIPEWLQDTASS